MKLEKPTIYLDMDGVLVDMDRRYNELFGHDLKSNKRLTESPEWDSFVMGDNFQTMGVMPGALGLIQEVMSHNNFYNVEILTSLGGKTYADKIMHDKKLWLQNQGITLKANFVIAGKPKGTYAKLGDILIDDTTKCIESFQTAGGHGILHWDIYQTLEQLDRILYMEFYNKIEQMYLRVK